MMLQSPDGPKNRGSIRGVPQARVRLRPIINGRGFVDTSGRASARQAGLMPRCDDDSA